MADGGRLEFREFGVFQLQGARRKKGRNPNHPENEVIIPEKTVVKFKPGKILKERVMKINCESLK